MINNAFVAVRKRTMSLISNLNDEDLIPQPSTFTSPVKWHIAHTTWFFEKMILESFFEDYKTFDNSYSFLFNSYYNKLGTRIERSKRGLITRPTVPKVLEYRAYVDRHIISLLETNSNSKLIELLILGINHEQQHQELILTDIKYTFWCNPTYPIFNSEFNFNTTQPEKEWILINEGIYDIGSSGNAFSFDNEHASHKVFLEAFEISNTLVSNEDFLEFIEAGGYTKSEFWLDQGWTWKEEQNLENPLYWIDDNGNWKQFTLAGLVDLNLNAPVCHISYFEANAYATWKNLRLPTEFEWEAASAKFDWGERWEWTNSAYLPYPRFKIKKGAVGEYNGKFMSNQMVLRGASIATTKGHSRPTYRNFFPPESQWQFSGIRLAKNIWY